MLSTIVFSLAVLTCLFSLISWAITADLIPFYQAYDHLAYFYYGYGSGYGKRDGRSGPLAVSAVELVIALFIFLLTPALAFFAWRERQSAGIIPRWLNLSVLGLSAVGFIVAIAQFGVFSHEGILIGEVAGQAAMFFLTTLLGISATILPYLPASLIERIKQTESQHTNATQMSEVAPKSTDVEAGTVTPNAPGAPANA
ncbi:uncharacterized protein UMAG_00831 [Mycosarcoma maydis]|uniref:Uncharacterized protein n=1 Tax=Mycosarcoma maydis TaxID=5270 RepID=A0A0D1CWW7_MYCMD|nr:uncharacterized protein UMAG_00831 [Ustilago maydis 521]KIS70903.1 hypothetical protein UMAG_00831 [Ustilago maydis 521]|eukprot:XP_011386869.1 hypothetical protein UMAG_00831 [Ustilago maydis 521]